MYEWYCKYFATFKIVNLKVTLRITGNYVNLYKIIERL